MACEICGRYSCTKSFHSLEEQNNFDDMADKVKESIRNYLLKYINRIDYIEIEDKIYIDIEKVEELVNDI